MRNRILGIAVLALLTLSCFEKKPGIGNTLTGAKIQVIGHGGSGFDSVDNYLPANSPKSIFQAIDILAADGVEVDVQLSKDSVLFLYHDDRLESQTNCTGCLVDHLFEDLKACRFRSNIAANFDQNQSLLTLASLLANFAGRPKPPWINIDLSAPFDCYSDVKEPEYFRTLLRQLSKLIYQYQAEDWLLIEATGLGELEYLQSIHPGLNLVWLGGVNTERLKITAAKGFWGVVTKNNDIDKDLIEQAHQLGLGVILYNVKIRQGTLEAVAKGPDLIETDNIPLLHAVLE